MLPKEVKIKSKELIKFASLEVALKFLLSKINEDDEFKANLNLLLARLNNLKRDNNLGTITTEAEKVERNRITKSFLDLIDEKQRVEKIIQSSPEEKSVEEKLNKGARIETKKLAIVGAIIGLGMLIWYLFFYVKPCFDLYFSGEFEDAKNCYNFKFSLSDKDEFIYMNCILVNKADNFFEDTDFKNALKYYLELKDTLIINRKRNNVITCIEMIKADSLFQEGDYINSRNSYKKVESSGLVPESILRKAKGQIEKINTITPEPKYDSTLYKKDIVEVFNSLSQRNNGSIYFSKNEFDITKTIVNGLNEKLIDNSDIVLLIDKTGSMKMNLNAIGRDRNMILETFNGKRNLRLAIVTFGDKLADGKDWFTRTDLVDDIASCIDFVKQVTPTEGGDSPEDVYDAIAKTITELDWRTNSNKEIFIIGDAIPKKPPVSSNSESDIVSMCKLKNIKINSIICSLGEK